MSLCLNLFQLHYFLSQKVCVFICGPCLVLVTMFYCCIQKHFIKCGNTLVSSGLNLSVFGFSHVIFYFLSSYYVLLSTASWILSISISYILRIDCFSSILVGVCERVRTCTCVFYLSEGLSSALVFQALRTCLQLSLTTNLRICFGTESKNVSEYRRSRKFETFL